MVPWFVVLPRLSPDTAGTTGVLMGFVFYRIGLAWLLGIHGLLGAITILVLSVWMALASQCARHIMTRLSSASMIWVLPFVFTGQEILRCEGLAQFRFPFLALGYSQSPNHAVAQIASIGGVYSITFLVVLVNAVIAHAVIHHDRRSVGWLLATIAMVGSLTMIVSASRHPVANPVNVACVQAENARNRDWLALTRRALEHPSRPRYVVLPEHTIADYARPTHPLVRGLADLARSYHACICVGAHTPAAPGSSCDYDNVSMLIGPDGTIVGKQAKFVPLPFFNDGAPARTQSTFVTPSGTAGTYVCYDGLFTDIPRRTIDLGAQMLLVPNMDPQRWSAQERWQHAGMAPLRCIELRRCAVRANSAGVSQIIDTTGRVVAQRTDVEGPGILVGTVDPNHERTWFVRGGHLLARVLGVMYLIVVVAMLAGTLGRLGTRVALRWRHS
jgi:apolipoprotein N-acyltransferase